jgi:uncharacterized damage-inducible protein DinB
MSSVEPAQARFFFEGVALPWFRNEYPLTKRVIEAIPLDKGDYRPAAASRAAFELAWHIVQAENRGQLSTYLRPMGVKVPSIYGQSYDDASR